MAWDIVLVVCVFLVLFTFQCPGWLAIPGACILGVYLLASAVNGFYNLLPKVGQDLVIAGCVGVMCGMYEMQLWELGRNFYYLTFFVK